MLLNFCFLFYYLFLFLIYCFSKFQVYNRVLFTIVTMLYIRSPEFINLLHESLESLFFILVPHQSLSLNQKSAQLLHLPPRLCRHSNPQWHLLPVNSFKSISGPQHSPPASLIWHLIIYCFGKLFLSCHYLFLAI